MAEKDGKTEKPTDKRLGEARKEGRIGKSPELVSWAALFIGLSTVQSTITKGGRFLTSEMDKMAALITNPDPHTALMFMVTSVKEAFILVAPLALIFMVVGIVGHVAQVRFVLAFKAVKPSFKKVNPVNGIKKMFSMQSTVEAAKQVAKVSVLGVVAYKMLHKTILELTMNGPYNIGEIIRITGGATMSFVKIVALVGVVIGIIDYFYQKKKVGDGMKMSKHEVKEESRQQDLPPEVKGALRRKQRQMSRNRMMAAIKTADVVVVNPIHIAVALKYDAQRGAPRVVAKGAGFVAEKIRDQANEHKVPLVQDISLARTLHRACDIDDEIPMEMFEAVAKVLAFIFALRNKGTASGFHKMPGTPDLADVERMEASGELIGV